MLIRKILILVIAVFLVSFIALNFDIISSDLGLGTKTGIGQADAQTAIFNSSIETRFFPIADFVPTITPPAGPAPRPNPPSPLRNPDITTTDLVLEIPSLKIKAPIVLEQTTDEKRIYKSLEKGVVHYSPTPQPGQSGTSIIIGHSSAYPWYKGNYGKIFADLSKLREGDIIKINKNGQTLIYSVSRSMIFSPKSADDYELRDFEETNGSSLVLMTCWPTGTNAKRIAVRADLI